MNQSFTKEAMAFLPAMAQWEITGTPVPFTRLTCDRNLHRPYWSQPYRSLFDTVKEAGQGLADEAFAALMASGATRTHSGQTSAGLIASGLSASAIRVPEINTGLLVAVSL